MAQTYTQIQKQIQALQKQAEKIKSSEVSGVVERIKTAIAHYSLTPEQLFGTSNASARTKTAASGLATGENDRAEGASSAAYADGSGNTWGGRGPRPRWLREALAAGKSLEEFKNTPSSTKAAAGAKKTTAGKSKGKRKARASYRDESGNSWSGFGPKPAWLRAALAAGKPLEDFTSPAKN